MPLDDNTASKDCLTPTADEMVQLHHDVFEGIKNLPYQSEIDFSKFADRDPWMDLYGDSEIAMRQSTKLRERFPTLASLLKCAAGQSHFKSCLGVKAGNHHSSQRV